MLLLSPTKVLVILVVALIVLGPDKLPGVARRVGALWSDVHRWRASVEREVRDTFPDLPPTAEIARAIRSPLALLDTLALDTPGEVTGPAAARAPSPPADGAGGGGDAPTGAPRPPGAASDPAGAPVPGAAGVPPPSRAPVAATTALDVPSLN